MLRIKKGFVIASVMVLGLLVLAPAVSATAATPNCPEGSTQMGNACVDMSTEDSALHEPSQAPAVTGYEPVLVEVDCGLAVRVYTCVQLTPNGAKYVLRDKGNPIVAYSATSTLRDQAFQRSTLALSLAAFVMSAWALASMYERRRYERLL